MIGTTINQYCYISCRFLPPIFDHNYRVVYSQTESIQTIEDIKHPVVKAVLAYLNFHQDRLEIHHDADLPARAGLGSSSAFTVGLLNALFNLRKQTIEPLELARLAIHIEQEKLQEIVGYQDQTLTAHGGFNRIDFLPDGTIHVAPVFSSLLPKLQNHLMLFYTGHSRFASDVAKSKVVNFKKNSNSLHRLREMVDEVTARLERGEKKVLWFGELLDEAWQLKKGLSDKISNSEIDEIYAKAKQAGATGGKILGAGGGGFMLLFVSPDLQDQVKSALSGIPKLCHIPFEFENHGSHLLIDREHEFTLT
ncbi:kinase [Simkania sp.]|uniref:GHMP family kinase ATP-binding protein n=1 Tax=Simkania sp. TaxID=34094 RepID=UPI003B524B38